MDHTSSPPFLSRQGGSLRAISYEQTKPAKPPIPITVAPSPTRPDNGAHPIHRPDSSSEVPASIFKAKSHLEKDVRRDSGLAPSSSTARDSRTTFTADDPSTPSIRSPPSLPNIRIDESSPPSSRKTERKWSGQKVRTPEVDAPKVDAPFRGITLDLPTVTFDDLSIEQMQFSKRGSMMIRGKKAHNSNGHVRAPSRRVMSNTSPNANAPTLAAKTLSADEELLSQKVRSMYEHGDGGEVDNLSTRQTSGLGEDGLASPDSHSGISTARDISRTDLGDIFPTSRQHSGDRRLSVIKREKFELAGGLEDWQDVDGGDVDRYGFIVPRRSPSQRLLGNSGQPASQEPQRLQRVSTSLQLATETPRRKHTIRRAPSNAKSARSATGPTPSRQPSRRSSRPPSSQGSFQSSSGGTSSRLRYAANRLPHNKDRKFMDEAGDMLTLPPGLADIAENEETRSGTRDVKKKEWEREEKWRKMAKVVSKGKDGSGMVFEFDTRNAKLIERTWKGIPDRWRATAWHAFLSASAKKRKDCPSDEKLVQTFHQCQLQSSPDDAQIDIDVPRTISSHIMFRRRYRGGQRLLFRVLHAMSLYFPDTGYVQGMAALAATLLAYYDEENAFVMLVRLWQLRGLDRLYMSGFEGLMEALDDFEKKWLDGGEISEKLTELGISPTAYGTRWYLTLFNYSIPFPAQLRVWDVFMLLGDSGQISVPSTSSESSSPFGKSLDVLHATSAALIDGTREILLDSDFENGMKVLTSWIPIKDEELFMRVAKAEWKMQRRKA